MSYYQEIVSADRYFEDSVMSSEWTKVISLYGDHKFYQTLKVKGRGTTLHVAISNGEKDAVEKLVDAITSMWNDDDDDHETHPLRILNERGATPLHIAAYRGFTSMCECIIGKNGQREDLIKVKNENGETPLFWAVLGQQKNTFVYLHKFFPHPDEENLKLVMDNNGTTILHVAIRREMFDLANIIMHFYGSSISSKKNKNGVTPLRELATRTSAFKNGNYLSWCEEILYFCYPLNLQNTEKELESLNKNVKEEIDWHNTCCTSIWTGSIAKLDAAQRGDISIHLNDASELEKQDKALSIFDGMSKWPILSLLEKIKIIKTRHLYAGQLLDKFKKNSNEYWGGGGEYEAPNSKERVEEIDDILKTVEMMVGGGFRSNSPQHPTVTAGNPNIDGDGATIYSKHKEIEDNKSILKKEESGTSKIMESLVEKIATKDTIYLIAAKNEIVEIMQELITKLPITSDKKGILLEALNNIEAKLSGEKIDPEETAYLVSAKNGIVEIMSAIESRIKNVIHERNSNNENVLLLAVKYKQPQIIEHFRKLSLKDKSIVDKNVFRSLCQQVDKKENTMLHLAAYTSLNKEATWRNIAGPAMQMMWDIKWYKYIQRIVPNHFIHRTNAEDETPGQIFKEEHKDLLEKSTSWLKDTAESCSVVAALIAGLSFATSGSVPGGNKESGKPALEGQPAFEGFAISSLIGLYFSGLALIMFLSILTSRKQIEDFTRDLPTKLLLGLTSLFVSIVAMFFSFCAGHFFVLTDKYGKHDILFYLIIVFIFPVLFYGAMQLPLYIDLVKVICKRVPPPSIKGVHL